MNDNITLIGMPGAGKSTLGVALAKKLGYRFVDTDDLVQRGEGRSLSEILSTEGVNSFIEIENEIIAGLSCEKHVIATGGSAVYGVDAMANLKAIGSVAFIDVSLEELDRRLDKDLFKRGVVIKSGSSLEDLYHERQPLYKKYADFSIRTDGMNTRQAVKVLLRAVEFNRDRGGK